MRMFDSYRKSQAEKKRQDDIANAERIFQVKEHNGELWLTHDGRLVCPCTMLTEPPCEAVKKMREYYLSNIRDE